MKKIIAQLIILAVLAAVAGAPAFTQQAAAKTPPPQKAPEKSPEAVAQPDRAVVPLSNPAKPAKVEAQVMRGSITVKGYEGKEVIAEARIRERPVGQPDELAYAYAYSRGQYKTLSEKDAVEVQKALKDQQKALQAQREAEHELQQGLALPAPPPPGQEDKKERSHEGMKLITAALTGLTVTEENNTVTVNCDSWKYAVDLTIQVPYGSSLELASSIDGKIAVENVSGELEIKGGNGSITLRNVSGSAVVHTMNGDIEAVLSKVSPDKPLSFSNMNGDIDITLPADIKASIKMKSQMGNIYSDFDVVLKSTPQKPEEVDAGDRGRYRIAFDKGILGTINGGGPEITLTSFNGSIFIRKKK